MYHSKSEANPIDVPTPSSNSRRLGRKPCVTFPNIKKKISAPTIKKITSIHRNPRFSAPGGCSPFWALLDFISAGWKSPCMTPRVCDWTLKPTRRGWCRKLLLNRDVKNDGFLRSDRNGGVVKCGFMLGCRCFFSGVGVVVFVAFCFWTSSQSKNVFFHFLQPSNRRKYFYIRTSDGVCGEPWCWW